MRIGILTRDINTLLNWELRIIEHIKNNPNFELVVLLKDGRQNELPKTSLFKKKNLIGKLLFNAQVRIENKIFHKSLSAVSFTEILNYLQCIPSENLNPNRDGISDVFNKEDTDIVKHYNLDVILKHEFNTIGGDILNAAKYGIWSFHHGDNSIDRVGPAGFWEIASKQPVVSVTLLQLTPESDDDLVIDKAHYSKHWSYVNTNMMLIENSVNLLLKNLRLLHEGQYKPSKSLEDHKEHYVSPKFITSVKYILHFYKSFINKIVDRILMRLGKRGHCWTLFVGKGDFMNASLNKIQPAELPKDEFWADPFLYKHKNETYIFFENYSYTTKLGKISCGRLDNTTITDVVEILNLEYHLSFPYIFENGDDLFMMPETSGNKRLEIYKCIAFPHKWELHKTAFEGENVVDAFFHTDDLNQTWLFLNKETAPDLESDSELYIYRVDSPALNTMEPHKQNPVIIDARVGRNGGCTFVHNDKTYRPSQSNTHGIYGRALNINEIETLTINEYKEKLITTVEPNFRKGMERMHHLHQIDDMFVFDAAYKRK